MTFEEWYEPCGMMLQSGRDKGSLSIAWKAGAASRDAEVAELKIKLRNQAESSAIILNKKQEQLASRDAEVAELKQTCIDHVEIQQALHQQLETERVRLAACGGVAMANTPESAAKAREMLPQYRSASCDDVAAAVDREMSLRQQLSNMTAERDKLQSYLDDWMYAVGPDGWIEALRQQLAELTMQCEKVVKWKYAMSYNDSYFGEPAGDLKRIVYEIERSMPIRGDK